MMQEIAHRPAKEWLLDGATVTGIAALGFAVATSQGTLPPFQELAGTLVRSYGIAAAAVTIGVALNVVRGVWLRRQTSFFPRGLFWLNVGLALLSFGYLINIVVLIESDTYPRWYGAPFASVAFTIVLLGYYWLFKREKFGRL